MSLIPPSATSRYNYQVIFCGALEAYRKKTGKDLTSDPLLRSIENSNSPDAVLDILRAQILEPGQRQNSRNRLTTWLDPTVNVLNRFSATIGGLIGQAYPPVGVIFTGIGNLLSTAQAVGASRGALIDLFDRMENIFRLLETYTDVPQTAGMTDAIIKVMVEVLHILAIATKEIKQNRTKKFLKKLVGRKDIEDALQRLEKVTVEEAQMAATEALKAVHEARNEVSGKVDGVQDTLKVFEERMRGVEGMLQGVGDILQDVDGRVKDIGNKVIPSVEESGQQMANVDDDVQGIAKVIDGVEKISRLILSDCGDLTRDQSRQDFVEWLSPPNPSINYNIARDTHHKGTAVWFTESSTFRDWKKSGSVLWIYGKPGSGKSVLTSAIIEDIQRISESGSAHMAYFFFDFKDAGKQDACSFLSSVLTQLSSQSTSLCNTLLEFYSAHQHGSQQPSESALVQCLEKMLQVPEVPLYLVIDALDECPDTSGMHSSREKVLELVEKLVGLHLPYLRLCITSRPEVDIRNVLEPLTSTSTRMSLHDEDGQKKAIVDYISSVVYSDKKIMKWPEQDKELVTKTLSDRADGMFRWVSCQFEALRRCLAPSLRRVLEELPETLDETYERILQEIPRVNRVHTNRLLQCLTVAIRPLRLQELAEVLAVDFSVTGGIPKLNEDWRWKDQELAVLTACSSLIAVINFRGSQMVQFSHFSVKEFLTSERLGTTKIDILRYYHVRLEPAHTIMAQACIGVLLRLEYPMNKEWVKMFPLADYAARHFTDHAEFGNVMSQITNGIDDLLDQDKPHFAAWMSLISSSWWADEDSGRLKASPLYHVADLGFYGLVQYLISKRPQDVTSGGGIYGTPVHAALHRRNVQVCRLLLPHCIGVDVRDSDGQTPLHVAAFNALPEIAQMIIEQGADVNARDINGWTPLHQTIDTYPVSNDRKLDIMLFLLDHGADREARNSDHYTPLDLAVYNGQLAAAKLLIERGARASIHARNKDHWTPLHEASFKGYPDIMRLLLKHGVDVEAVSDLGCTALHAAACGGQGVAARLLVENGASLEVENYLGRTPLHDASSHGHPDIIRLLLERGANIDARDNHHCTPLFLTAFHGQLTAAQLLVHYGADVYGEKKDKWTSLHEASFKGYPDIMRLLLKHRVDQEGVNDLGCNALHAAACTGQGAVARLLIENGASLEVKNYLGRTPLHDASSCGHPDVIQLLLERGANIEARDDYHSTPLYLTASHGQFTSLQRLVEHGANVHVRNKDGWTPLHEASSRGYSDIVLFLLEHNADVDVRNSEYATPLHSATFEGKLEATQLLLAHGANVHAQDKARKTPVQLASMNRHEEVVRLLSQHALGGKKM